MLSIALVLLSPDREIVFLRGGENRLSIKGGVLAFPMGMLAGLGIAFSQSSGLQWPDPGQAVAMITNNLFFPAVEELEFRGFLLGWMVRNRIQPSLAIWLVAIIHTLAHPHYLWQGNYVSFVGIFFLTAWFGWLTIRTHSLWGAYIAHALWNISFFIPTVNGVKQR